MKRRLRAALCFGIIVGRAALAQSACRTRALYTIGPGGSSLLFLSDTLADCGAKVATSVALLSSS